MTEANAMQKVDEAAKLAKWWAFQLEGMTAEQIETSLAKALRTAFYELGNRFLAENNLITKEEIKKTSDLLMAAHRILLRAYECDDHSAVGKVMGLVPTNPQEFPMLVAIRMQAYKLDDLLERK